MRKLLAILLLISFSVQITGVHFFYHLRQISVKKAVKERLRRRMDSENTEQFVFTVADKDKIIEWDGDDEFRYKGEMYDVIEKKVEYGKIIILCINDRKETTLIKQYKKSLDDDFGRPAKKRTSLLLKIFNSFYTPVANTILDRQIAVAKYNWHSYSCSLSFASTEVLTPPPQFA